jgi:hypothetical protein
MHRPDHQLEHRIDDRAGNLRLQFARQLSGTLNVGE